MKFRKQSPSIEELKDRDMVDYLSKLGHNPAKVRNVDYWYLSPLRDERTPSFKINRKLNRWYDHGLGKGGNLVDFAVLYHNCTIGEFIQKAAEDLFFQQQLDQPTELEAKENKIKIINNATLTSSSLLYYLHQRRIPIHIAQQYCSELDYEIDNRTYYGIGFKNDSGGFEIRNPYVKVSSSPKDITTLKTGAKVVVVFEGFIDFLSFITIHQNQHQTPLDFLILNSASFFEKGRAFMEKHEAILLYLDRDKTGQNCSQYALSLSPKYKDESELYNGYKDLNEWLVNIGKGKRIKLGHDLS